MTRTMINKHISIEHYTASDYTMEPESHHDYIVIDTRNYRAIIQTSSEDVAKNYANCLADCDGSTESIKTIKFAIKS